MSNVARTRIQLSLCLGLSACVGVVGEPPQAFDSGRPDAGFSDAGFVLDAGSSDAGSFDAGTPADGGSVTDGGPGVDGDAGKIEFFGPIAAAVDGGIINPFYAAGQWRLWALDATPVHDAGYVGSTLFEADFAPPAPGTREYPDLSVNTFPAPFLGLTAPGLAALEGIELAFATNFVSRVAFNDRVLPALRAAAPSRLVHVAAAGMPGTLDLDHVPPPSSVSSFRAHNAGQHANDVYGLALQSELKGTGVSVSVFNRNGTGFVGFLLRAVDLMLRPFATPPARVAEAIVRASNSPENGAVLLGPTGKPVSVKPAHANEKLQSALMVRVRELVHSRASILP